MAPTSTGWLARLTGRRRPGGTAHHPRSAPQRRTDSIAASTRPAPLVARTVPPQLTLPAGARADRPPASCAPRRLRPADTSAAMAPNPQASIRAPRSTASTSARWIFTSTR